MSERRTLTLVDGYVPAVDGWPKNARRCGFPHRFAFVLETYRAGSVDAYFDRALYESILAATWHEANAHTAIAVDETTERECRTLPELLTLSRELDEPIAHLTLLSETSAPILIIESEPWTRVGGPMPYHDSYTLALFSASTWAQRLIRVAGALEDISLAPIVTGRATPPSLMDRLRSFLR